jgi:hypothetical protein
LHESKGENHRRCKSHNGHRKGHQTDINIVVAFKHFEQLSQEFLVDLCSIKREEKSEYKSSDEPRYDPGSKPIGIIKFVPGPQFKGLYGLVYPKGSDDPIEQAVKWFGVRPEKRKYQKKSY